jgi:hypothetical protein
MTLADAKLAACAVLWLLSLVVVGFGCYMIRDSMDAPENIEPAPEVRQDDGSVVLERDPQPASEPAPHTIPPGHVEERRISVQVQPDVIRKSDTTDTTGSVTPACECKPVRVDLSLVRDTEGGRRVITSSPDGDILGGLDVPIVGGSVPVQRKWAAGISHEPFRKLYGGWVDRDVGRFRLGTEIKQYEFRDERGLEVWLKVGWNF